MYIYPMPLNSHTMPDLLFTVNDVARTLHISTASARVLCSRYSKSNKIIRIRNNLYILAERWNYLTLNEKLRIANRIQVPSYISFSTAINYYELTDQMYRGWIESVARQRSINYSVKELTYVFRLMKADYYQGYTLRDGIFIAIPEKALADIVYYTSIGRYAFDFSAVSWDRVDSDRLLKWLSLYPPKTLKWIQRRGYF